MTVKHLYIVRHGNTFDPGDTVLRVGAGTNLPLSRSGMAQAQALGQHFAEMGIAPQALYVSPLKRTQMTANAIRATQPQLPAWQIDDRLNEIHYGPDEGQPEEQVVARIGAEALQAWEQTATPPPGWNVEPAQLVMNWSVLLDGLRNHDADCIVVVTSNGTARFVLPLCDDPQGLATETKKLKTGAYGLVHIPQQGRPQLKSWNIRP